MTRDANRAPSSAAGPALLTLFALGMGAALYYFAGMNGLAMQLISAPFFVIFAFMSWGVPTLDERYARDAQPVRSKEAQREMHEAAAQ